MRKYLALLLTAIAGFAVAEGQIAKDIYSTVESVTPEFTNPVKDSGNIPTTFPYQPPLVPHSIKGLQVTKNANQCLGCHAPEVSATTGATTIPKTHFEDRDGKPTQGSSPRRYFCLQCHVQQTDVNPIIQNKFNTIREHKDK